MHGHEQQGINPDDDDDDDDDDREWAKEIAEKQGVNKNDVP
ncbi:MAG: hypothetical protein ACI843_000269 [Psychrobacter glaciei]